MSFLKTRESAEIDTSPETEVEGEIREFVRRDVVGIRRQPESDSELVANNINQLLGRVAGTSVQEINRLLKQYQDMADITKKMKKLGPKGLSRHGLAGLLPGGLRH